MFRSYKKDADNLRRVNESLEEKLNNAQALIARNEGESVHSREVHFNYKKQYEALEVVNAGINYIVNDAAEMPLKVGDSINLSNPVVKGVRATTLWRLLNVEPNPFQDISTFKRNLIIDLIIDGNIFIYWDGAHLYHLPADKMVIKPDPVSYISHFEFDGKIDYTPNEIIHIKENSFHSIYRGISRLRAADRSMRLLISMRSFQDNFFKNGAVPGLVIKSPNTLSERIKERYLHSWNLRYRPDSGGRRPLILDGGMEIDEITNISFKELDFESSIQSNEVTILKALGVPPILLDSGNNANIRPNHRLFYLETILPIVNKLNHALSRFFGYQISADTTQIPALQPELKDQASYLTTLTNGGVISANEARVALGMEPKEGHDDLRIPANIAGSAADPSQGGRPQEGED
jgi:HK97 family phage portal protein